MSTLVTLGRSSTISRPHVPWPAMMAGSSYGSTITSPRSSTSRSASRCRSSESIPVNWISAPSRSTPSIFTRGASRGMQITACAPSRRAARATAWAWLPEE